MFAILKWGLIIWTLLCLSGCIIGVQSVSESLDQPMSEMERTAAEAGAGIGMFLWVIIWGAIAVPLGILSLVFKPSKA